MFIPTIWVWCADCGDCAGCVVWPGDENFLICLSCALQRRLYPTRVRRLSATLKAEMAQLDAEGRR